MDAVDRLRRDHKILRSKLNVVESALKMGPETWFVLREACFTLSRQLGDHMKREEDLVAACRRGMNPKVLAELAVEHRDEPKLLRGLNRMFLTERGHSLEQVRPTLTQLITGLRHHMEEEERELFPILERFLAEEMPQEPVAPGAPMRLHEEMTVNRVIAEFPHTRPVFEQLFINLPIEGCTCLDEVAWQHGMDSRELLQQLEDVIKTCQCAEKRMEESEAVASGA